MSGNTVSTKLRSARPKKQTLYILVIGLTGAGKSTFISVATGNEDIPIGPASELDGGTHSIPTRFCFDAYTPSSNTRGSRLHPVLPTQSRPLRNPSYRLTWIRRRNFHAQVLSRIAAYVNTHYELKKRLAGVLCLHDITKARVGGVAQSNLCMLENMIGMEKCNNCTLVTTKWGCTTNMQDEEEREKTLRETKK